MSANASNAGPSTSHGVRQTPRHSQFTVFERNRPRSRVLVISRRPSRIRKRPSIATVSSPKQDVSIKGDHTSSHPNSLATAQPGIASQPPAPAYVESVSSINSPAGVVSEPSEVSLDLDSFPIPPTYPRAQLLPNGQEPLPTTSHLSKGKGKAPLDSVKPPVHKVHEREQNDDLQLPKRQNFVLRPKHNAKDQKEPLNVEQTQRKNSTDDVTAEVVSRGLTERLRLLSLSSQRSHPRASRNSPTESRTPSQREALNRFTQDLQRYAENVGAKGKIPIFTPTPLHSPATLRTISALLPFRPEFRDAGLAVTSQDQARRLSQNVKDFRRLRAERHRRVPSQSYRARALQVDGKHEALESASTEVDFVNPNNTDDWRYVLIDELPVVGSCRRRLTAAMSASRIASCLPCLPRIPERREYERYRDQGIADLQNLGSTFKAAVSPTKQKRTLKRKDRRSTIRVVSYSPPPKSSGNRPQSRKRSAVTAPATSSRRATGVRPRSLTLPHNSKNVSTVGNLPNRAYSGTKKQLDRPKTRNQVQRDSKSREAYTPGGPELAETDDLGLPSPRADAGPSQAPLLPDTSAHGTKLIPPYVPRRRTTKRVRKAPDPSQEAIYEDELARHDPLPPPKPVSKLDRASAATSRRPEIPGRTSSLREPPAPAFERSSPHKVNDRDILRGLHIAAAAACDELIDSLVHKKTGVHVRRFLADLVAFEALDPSQSAEAHKELVSRRRSQMRQLKQQARRSQEVKRASRPNA